MAKGRSRYGRKKRTIKKSMKRKFRKRSGRTTIPKQMSNLGLGFPKMLKMTHKYNDFFSMTDTGIPGLQLKKSFRCNSLFDPNITDGGHKVMYYDQLSALYNHYVVIGSSIKITVQPQSGNQVARVVLIQDDNDSTLTDIGMANEQTNGGHVKLINNLDKVFLSRKWSAKKTFGGSILSNNDLQGSSSNPAEQSFFQLYIQSVSSGAASVWFVNFELSYIAIWKELKDVVSS